MRPILLTVGPFSLYTYGLALVIAFAVTAWLGARAARRTPQALRAIAPEQAVDFSSVVLLGGIIGARIFFVLLHWAWFAGSPLSVLALWEGGLVWYGGLFGGLASGWWYVRASGLSFRRVLDHVAPFAAMGHAIGRVGCFWNGCCYGRPTTAWCGMVFPGQPHAVWPTQLFEAAGLLGLALALRALQRSSMLAHPGRLFGVYLAAYGVLRFAVEFLRGDQTVWWAGLTLQQAISILSAVVGLTLWLPRAPASRRHRWRTL